MSSRFRVLPTFKGFTVDDQLRQFRKGTPETGMEFIDFDSEQGKRLLGQMMDEHGEHERKLRRRREAMQGMYFLTD